MSYAFTTMHSPIGRIELVSDGSAITLLSIEGTLPTRHGTLFFEGDLGNPDAVLTQAVRELTEYFDRERTTFSVPVSLSGTTFRQAIWREVEAVPFGHSESYGDLARRAGIPQAARAVGGAVGSNPVPILVPCHRILAQDKRLTGYSSGSGIATKITLLDFEGIEYRL